MTGEAAPPAVQDRRAGVLGSPIRHSLSPALHRAAYGALGLAWDYRAYQVDEGGLASFLHGLDQSWAGLSLTMPLKRAVIPLLDEVSPLGVSVEAVNTVLFDRGAGPRGGPGEVRRRGENTDMPGMVAALRERGVAGVTSAAVLGGGATAASAVAAVREVCAGEITVYVRGAERAAEMHRVAERLEQAVRIASWHMAAGALRAELVVSTTPAGATDDLAPGLGPGPGVLFDVVYDPWPTRLAAGWTAAGGVVVSGLDLLVHQAVLQVELMTGITPAPLAVMRAAGERELAARAAPA